MSSKYFLFGVCCLLALTSQGMLFLPAFGRGVPVSSATSSRRVDVDHPGTTDIIKPPRIPPGCKIPPFCRGGSRSTSTEPPSP